MWEAALQQFTVSDPVHPLPWSLKTPFLEDHRVPELTVTFASLVGACVKDHARLLWAESR